MNNRALVVGGNSGIGLAVTVELLKKGYEFIHIVGKGELNYDLISNDYLEYFKEHTEFYSFNLLNDDYSLFNEISEIDTLIITAGFGRVSKFENLTEPEIINLIKCNELSVIRIVKHYYEKIHSHNDFLCAVIGSIAGHISSPLFSVYSAGKAGVCRFIESINAELAAENYANRILDISPGKIEGTGFNGGKNDLSVLSELANDIIDNMEKRNTLFIPQYEETYKRVINNYRENALAFGIDSYKYKVNGNRLSNKPQVTVGYLSGTFDLFHIGHLNLLKRAKQYCDYLVVGVHKSGAWKGKETFIPFEERLAIVESIKYVDKAIESFSEDSDAYNAINYDFLFVGSDYKGSERFNRYEEYFADKGVKIIYFPYTNGTSSTQLREKITENRNEDR